MLKRQPSIVHAAYHGVLWSLQDAVVSDSGGLFRRNR